MAVSADATDVLGAVVTLAMIAVLVRPGSQGPGLVKNFLSGFGGLVGSASGGAWNTPQGTRG